MDKGTAGPKQYPFEEEDKKFELQILEAIKQLPLEQRLQAIALNTYLLAKKQADSVVGDKMEEIDSKYRKLQEPVEKKINEVIAGERALVKEEIEYAKKNLTEEEVNQIDQNLTTGPVDEYWFKVLTTCVRFQNDIFECDHPLLKKITKIESAPGENRLTFTITFHFAENEYFENTSLSAKFTLAEDEVPEKLEGTEIKWKEGKDITSKTITKKKKNKKTGKKVNVTKTVEADSFFNLFKTIDSTSEDEEKDEEDEEANEAIQKLQDKYDIAMTIQEEILIYHLEYYLGLRKGDEDYDMPGDEEEFDDDEEDDGKGIPLALKKKLGLVGKK